MAKDAESERREAKRASCRGEIEYWIGSVQFSAYYADISTKGIFIETLNPADPGTRCKMRFTLPGHHGMIETEGVVIWSSVAMGMGVKFLSLTPDDSTAIRSLTAERQTP